MAYRRAATRLRNLRDEDYPDGPEDSTPDPQPEQQLAAAVLRQALTDARNAHLPKATRDQARWFISGGSEGLQFWCEIAGLRPQIVQTLAGRALVDKGV